jgi:hypothetical protein
MLMVREVRPGLLRILRLLRFLRLLLDDTRQLGRRTNTVNAIA